MDGNADENIHDDEIHKKKIDSDAQAPFEMTTETLILMAIKRGLLLSDFEMMTVGMITDFLIECINDQDNENNGYDSEETTREATQFDIDRF